MPPTPDAPPAPGAPAPPRASCADGRRAGLNRHVAIAPHVFRPRTVRGSLCRTRAPTSTGKSLPGTRRSASAGETGSHRSSVRSPPSYCVRRRASSGQQRARVLTGVKGLRYAPPPLRGADALDAGSAHARPDWPLDDDARSDAPFGGLPDGLSANRRGRTGCLYGPVCVGTVRRGLFP